MIIIIRYDIRRRRLIAQIRWAMLIYSHTGSNTVRIYINTTPTRTPSGGNVGVVVFVVVGTECRRWPLKCAAANGRAPQTKKKTTVHNIRSARSMQRRRRRRRRRCEIEPLCALDRASVRKKMCVGLCLCVFSWSGHTAHKQRKHSFVR